MQKKSLYSILFISLGLALSGCTKGFQTSSNPADLVQNANGNNSNSTGSNASNLSGVQITGLQNGGDKPGRTVVTLDREHQALIITLPFPTNPLITDLTQIFAGMGQTPIPGLLGAYFFVDAKGYVNLSVPLVDIVRNANFLSSQAQNQLPSGQSLPGFPSGEGAEFAVTLAGSHPVYIYFGVKAVAVFMETPEWNSVLTCGTLPICPNFGPWPIKNQGDSQILGYVSFILANHGYSSGAYVSVQIPDAMAQIIDNDINYSAP